MYFLFSILNKHLYIKERKVINESCNVLRFGEVMKEAVYDWKNTDRREVGKGFVGRLFDRQYKHQLPDEVQSQIKLLDQHRFSYIRDAILLSLIVTLVYINCLIRNKGV